MIFPYQVGKEYNRAKDLHDQYGGSRQSGMCPSADNPVIFLFTGSGGAHYGYEDRFTDDGRFFYPGEGQVGDMQFTKGNLALRDHVKNEKHVLLFEQTRKGYCRYLGEFSYLGYHFENRPDRESNKRQAIIFELAREPLEVIKKLDREPLATKNLRLPKNIDLKRLRDLAISGSSDKVSSKSVETRIYYRNIAIKRYALERAKGICEACGSKAPFISKKGRPYLEAHHLNQVSDGGPDHPQGVAAICPNCHRNIHNGIQGEDVNKNLKEIIFKKEN